MSNVETNDLLDANIYIVQKVGWEYDDSNYYRSESHGGRPQNAFTVQSLADNYAKEQDCKWFIKCLTKNYDNPSDYLDTYTHKDEYIEKLVSNINHLNYVNGRFTSDDPNLIKFDELYNLIQNLELVQHEVVGIKLVA